MSSSISSSFPNTSPSPVSAGSNTAAAPPNQQTTAEPADTVKLSVSQQVRQLYDRGQKVSQIASSLSLPVEVVNSYLGISGSAG